MLNFFYFIYYFFLMSNTTGISNVNFVLDYESITENVPFIAS